jgi:alpha,alpha-trehalose phosphorylase
VEEQASIQSSAVTPASDDRRAVDPWQLIRRNPDPAGFAQDESLFALANGALGVRGGIEEDASSSQGTFLAGVWERSPIEYHERFPGFARSTDTRIPIADATRIQIRLGDTPVRLSEGRWLDFERRLDLRNGCYQRRLRWQAPDGATLEIEAERIVAMDEPGLLAIRYCVRSIDYTGPITLESAIDTSRDALAQGSDPRIGAHLSGGLSTYGSCAGETAAWLRQRTSHSHIRLVCAQRHRLCDSRLRFRGAMDRPNGVAQVFAGTLTPGESVALDKYVAYAWSTPGGDESDQTLLSSAEATLDHAHASGDPDLRKRQALALERLWREADLAVDAHADVEQALRLNLFHLFQSSGRDGSSSTAAKGLTGEGYEGNDRTRTGAQHAALPLSHAGTGAPARPRDEPSPRRAVRVAHDQR